MESKAPATKAAENDENRQTLRKIDPFTTLQDAIDGLSLGIFESLRSLRDAVAPESGNLGVNPNQNNNNGNSNKDNEPDIEELWSSYKNGDQKVRDLMHKGDPDHPVIQKREDFIRMHAKMEMRKDTDLVFRLAGTVLSKSQDIDDQVERLPGMEWTRDEQMQRIKELLGRSEAVKQELQETYNGALALRNECRRTIKANTSKSLEIKEEKT